jgi:hypothetical protein
MSIDHIGPFGFYNWFKDDWLVSRRAVKLFLVAALFVLGTIPIFLGKIDPAKLAFWMNFPLGIGGILGPISVFFLWIGMWRYWIRLDNSSKLAKQVSFFLLLFGMFYGSVIYYFLVYRSQVMTASWAEPGTISREGGNESLSWGLQKVFLVGLVSIFAFSLAFGLFFPILLRHFLSPQSDYKYEMFLGLSLSAGVISFFVFLIAMLFRLGTKTREGNNERSRWSFQKIILVALGAILSFAVVFVLLVPILLNNTLPPQYEDNYEVFLGLGLVVGAVIFFVYLIVMLFRAWTKTRQDENVHPSQGLQKRFLIGFFSLFGFMLVFGFLFIVLLGKFLPKYARHYSAFVSLAMIVGIISLAFYLIVGVYRLGMKTRR